MPSWPALRGKVLAFRRREGVPCSSRSSKSEILVKALMSIRSTLRDIIAIMQSIAAAGSLDADLEVI